MNKKITIIDYGTNNTASVYNAIKYLGYNPKISSKRKDILFADYLILPGIGSFKSAMKNIKLKKIDIYIKEAVNKKKKLLGICLGMQLLCNSSLEIGFTKGLGLINAKVIKWKKNPDIHIGFNSVKFKKETKLLKNLENYSDFYFVHSFYLKINKAINGLTGITKFNNEFISAYENKNMFATQFHPEKSQKNGLIVLKNFCEM